MEGHSIDDLTGDEAEPKRGRKPGMSVSEYEERDANIVRDHLRGASFEFLAKKHEVTTRRAREIWEKWRQENPASYKGRDPIVLVQSMLERLEAWVEQLAEVADGAEADATRISAINSQVAVMTRSAELMQATGILPHNLGTLRLELDVQLLAVRLVTVLTEKGATPELKQAVLETLKTGTLGQPVSAG